MIVRDIDLIGSEVIEVERRDTFEKLTLLLRNGNVVNVESLYYGGLFIYEAEENHDK